MDVIFDWSVSKYERKRHQNLEANYNHETFDEINSTLIILHLPKETWQQQKHSCFHAQPNCEEQAAPHGPVCNREVNRQNDIKHHNFIIV